MTLRSTSGVYSVRPTKRKHWKLKHWEGKKKIKNPRLLNTLKSLVFLFLFCIFIYYWYSLLEYLVQNFNILSSISMLEYIYERLIYVYRLATHKNKKYKKEPLKVLLVQIVE